MSGRSKDRTATRWAVVRLLMMRLSLREDKVARRVQRTLVGSAILTLVCATLVLVGVSHLALVAAAGIGSMVVLATLCLRLFPPAMAVSVVGVALSCASLMTALSVTTGFRLEITRAMGRINGHVLLTKYGLDFFEYDQIADRWTRDPRVTAASPFAYSMVAVVGGVEQRAKAPKTAEEAYLAEVPDDPQERAAPLLGPSVVIGKGIDPQRAAQMEGFADLLGRGDVSALRPGDTAHLPGLVLGDALARAIGVEVGDRARIVVPAELDGQGSATDRAPRHATFEVLDVLHSGTSEFDRNLALMHLSAAQAVFFQEGRVTGIEFQLDDPEQAAEVAADMEDELGFPFRTSTWKDTNSAILVGLEQIRMTLSLILGLMVLVSASSLIASLLLVVRRKRKDIAVMQALGGDRSLVFWVFEVVGLMVGAVGASMGLALGALYCAIIDAYRYPLVGDVYPVDHLPVVISAQDVLGPAVAAIALCGIASGPVAFMAARVKILEAFRR